MANLFSSSGGGGGVTLFSYTNEEDYLEALLEARLTSYYTKSQSDSLYVRNVAIQNINMNGFRITNVADPINSNDAVNLGYLTNIVQNIDASINLLNQDVDALDISVSLLETTKLDKTFSSPSDQERVLVTDADGNIITSSNISTTELESLNNISGNIQNQLNDKQDEQIGSGSSFHDKIVITNNSGRITVSTVDAVRLPDIAINTSDILDLSNTLDTNYYDSSEVDTLLSGKSDTGHTHVTDDITNLSSYTGFDSRYYTEGEINALLAGKSDTGHTHVADDITNLSSYTGFDSRYINVTGDTVEGLLTVNTATSEKIRLQSTSDIADMWMTSYDQSGNRLWIVNMGDRSGGNEFAIYSQETSIYEMRIKSSGQFGFGKAPSTIYKVDVDGSLNATALFESGTLLSAKYAPISHTHVTDDITNLSSYTGFDARYYTEGEINALLAGKSDTGHTHVTSDITNLSAYTGFDARYYTESEVDTLLNDKSDTGHTHVTDDITNLSSYTGFDARYVRPGVTNTFTADQTMTGGAECLKLKTDSGNHVYMSFYRDFSNINVRSGYIGYGNAGSNILTIDNEQTGNVVNIRDFIQENGVLLTDKYAQLGSTNTFTEPVYINNDTDVTTSGSSGALIIGDMSGTTIGIDGNEIQARNVDAKSILYLNNDGGDVRVAGSKHIFKDNGVIGVNTMSPGAGYNLDVNGDMNADELYENGTALSSKYLQQIGGELTGDLKLGNPQFLNLECQSSYVGTLIGHKMEYSTTRVDTFSNFGSTANTYYAPCGIHMGYFSDFQAQATDAKRVGIGFSTGFVDDSGVEIKDRLKMYIEGTGNVGIGTNTPASRLHIVNEDSSTGGADSIINSSSEAISRFDGSANTLLIGESVDTIQFNAYSKTSFSISKNIVLNAGSGNVGIGTTAPQTKLNIRHFTGSAGATEGDSSGSHPEFDFFRMSGVGDSGDVNSIGFGMSIASQDNSIISPNGMVHFKLNQGASGNNFGETPNKTVMTLQGGGNVGIGTTSPSELLDVDGGSLRVDSGDNDNQIKLVRNGTLTIGCDAGADPEMVVKGEGIFVDSTGTGSNTGRLTFNSSKYSNIDYFGNGAYLFTSGVEGTTSGAEYWWIYGGREDYELFRVTRNGGVRLSRYLTNGTLSVTNSNGTVISSSDRRLKTNIQYQTDTQQALTEVNAWKPAVYEWKENGDSELGFIAQDIEEAGIYSSKCVDGKRFEYDFVYEFDMIDKEVEELDESGNLFMTTVQVKGKQSDRVVTDACGNPVLDYSRPRYRGVSDRGMIAVQTLAIQELNKKVERLESSGTGVLLSRVESLETELANYKQYVQTMVKDEIEKQMREIRWNM